MEMELRHIDGSFADGKRLFDIYNEASPENERIPDDRFMDVMREYGCTPWAIYDGEDMVGFTCVMHNAGRRIGYLWYFAIAAARRNCGYGGSALRLLKDKYADCQLVLDMELLDAGADNYGQRISRLRFYERNGFERAFVGMSYLGMDFELMCDHAPLRLDDFKAVIGKVADNFFHPVFRMLSRHEEANGTEAELMRSHF